MSETATPGPKPRWDRDRLLLYVGPHEVKRFRRVARNQQLVLEAFEEEGWPHRIDDPLPQTAGLNPKHRLHDTINNLNRRLAPILRFTSDGEGKGVCWHLV